MNLEIIKFEKLTFGQTSFVLLGSAFVLFFVLGWLFMFLLGWFDGFCFLGTCEPSEIQGIVFTFHGVVILFLFFMSFLNALISPLKDDNKKLALAAVFTNIVVVGIPIYFLFLS